MAKTELAGQRKQKKKKTKAAPKAKQEKAVTARYTFCQYLYVTLNFTLVETAGGIIEVKVIEASKTKLEYIQNSLIFTMQIIKISSRLEIQISQLND